MSNLSRRSFLRQMAQFGALAALPACARWTRAPKVSPADKPNILFILVDDLGWGDVGYHNDEMRTPNLDALAKSGVELDCHYVMPQCTPTRVALVTGRYPSRFGDHCTQASNDQAYPLGTPTVASMLKPAGYATALTGKWHMGSKLEWGPNHFGFDYSYGSLAGAVGMYDHRYRLNTPYAQTWHRNHEFIEEEGHATDLTVQEAVKWIESDRDEPFFLYVPFHTVHTPLVEEERWLAINRHIADHDRRLFAAAVSHMDWAVGEVVSALDRAGQRGKTLVVFVSDNGAQVHHKGGAYPPPDPKLTNFSSNLPLRGKKCDVYEGGIRVPAFASWPGVLKPRRVTAPMHMVDWVPTFLALAGTEPSSGVAWDGQDLWPVLKDEAKTWSRTLYWVWGKGRRRVALRHGDWKILKNDNKRDRPWELYNLSKDPYEKNDLAKEMPGRVEALTKLFAAEKAKDAG